MPRIEIDYDNAHVVAILIAILLGGLELTGILNIGWGWVLAPLWIPLGLVGLLGMLIMFLSIRMVPK